MGAHALKDHTYIAEVLLFGFASQHINSYTPTYMASISELVNQQWNMHAFPTPLLFGSEGKLHTNILILDPQGPRE